MSLHSWTRGGQALCFRHEIHTHTQRKRHLSHKSPKIRLSCSSPCTEEMLPETPCHLPCHLPCFLYSTEGAESKTPPYRAFSFKSNRNPHATQTSSFLPWLAGIWAEHGATSPLQTCMFCMGLTANTFQKEKTNNQEQLRFIFFLSNTKWAWHSPSYGLQLRFFKILF